ncbi:MAG: hypothetical protein LQ337_005406 [Flavoplaca oasis]|nr:MAG: hypothetical protein LQ337_005406 [Flavoplaca oasis]
MLFSSHNILFIVFTFQLYISAHALPPAAPPSPQIIAAPLNKVNTSNAEQFDGNCHGSLWCSLYGGHFIFTAYQLVTKGLAPGVTPGPGWNTGPMNDTAFYAEGAHAVCMPVPSRFSQGGGFCVFTEDPIGRGVEQPGVTGKMIKLSLRRLLEMNCRMCGIVSSGDDWGWVTADYVTGPVCGGVCPEAVYEAVTPTAIEISRLIDWQGGRRDTN